MRIVISFTIPDRAMDICKRIWCLKKYWLIIFPLLCSTITIAYTASDYLTKQNTFNKDDIVNAAPLNQNFKDLYDAMNNISMVKIEDIKKRLNDMYASYFKKINNYNRLLDNLLSGGIPVGMIVICDGPLTDALKNDGWRLCDGNNGTPDLRDTFIVGAAKDQGDSVSGGLYAVHDKNVNSGHSHAYLHSHDSQNTETCEEHRHCWANANYGTGSWYTYNNDSSLFSIAHAPSHLNNSIGSPGHVPMGINNVSGTTPFFTDYSGEHKHSFKLTYNTGDVISTSSDQALPAYHAYYFIMKVK